MLAHTTCAWRVPSCALFVPGSGIYIHAHIMSDTQQIQAVCRGGGGGLHCSSRAAAMGGPSSSTRAFKQGFLRSFLLSLKSCRNGAMCLQERKRAVRSSADIAMATTRGSGAMWPQALLASSSSSSWPRLLPAASTVKTTTGRKKVARRCCGQRRRTSSGEIARRLVRKRTKVLRGMVPGGELLDGASLLREAMDYVVHLRAQVAVLRRVSSAMQHRPSSHHMAGAVAPPVQLKTEAIATAQVLDGGEE
ncbi:transcription factor IBH1-like 1 [Hordeum vulgare subsp. vulgare]|uniref:IBH1-like N-terminal domain-containing protein n=1 Tax=Hordeum vulgare subsp. vulgare TaxID=112509 RepID=A0A8I6Y9S2_HORVV|nr:transcription factor IBH1-like 1 [Hordeum vulgare subsp. vulgare]